MIISALIKQNRTDMECSNRKILHVTLRKVKRTRKELTRKYLL